MNKKMSWYCPSLGNFSHISNIYITCTLFSSTSILEQLSVFTVVAFPNEQCQVVSDKVTKGTCMTSTECTDFAGTKDGNCAGGFGVCCLIG